jgi:hypothetical protein
MFQGLRRKYIVNKYKTKVEEYSFTENQMTILYLKIPEKKMTRTS